MKLKEKRIGCVTLLVSDDERSERKGFIVDGQEPVYSIARIPRLHLEGRATVDAHSYFADKLHAYATECLDEYANANMDSTAFYNCSAFWADALLRAGDNATPRVMVFFSKVGSGILEYSINGFFPTIEYNVAEDSFRFLKYHAPNDSYMECPAHEAYFHPGRPNLLVAERQAEDGKAPMAFAEVLRINNFLRGRHRNLRAVFRGSREVKLKPVNKKYSAASILTSGEEGLVIDRSLIQAPLSELTSFQCGNAVLFPVNSAALADMGMDFPTKTVG